MGRTQDVLIANTLPITGFLAALTTLHFNCGASGVAICVAIGEIIALAFALERSDRDTKESHNQGRKLGTLFLSLMASCMIVISFSDPVWTNVNLLFGTPVLLSLAVGGIVFINGALRSWLIKTSRMVIDRGIRSTP
jgi:hypothetical protein